jgi:hypothetical protein
VDAHALTALALPTFAAALVLAAVYALGRRLRAVEAPHRRRWVSAAAGASVAYIFVDLLPELGARQQAFVKAAGGELLFAEQRIYVVALVGFVVFYGLDHMVLVSRDRRLAAAGEVGGNPVYWLHVGGFAVYSALIGYLLAERGTSGRLALVLYSLAMAFHFLVVDHSLRQEHAAVYDRRGRWLLAASVLAGWLVGTAVRVPEALLARVFAFVAGGVVITSATAELPGERQGRFAPFGLGAAVYAVLLLLGTGGDR